MKEFYCQYEVTKHLNFQGDIVGYLELAKFCQILAYISLSVKFL